MKNIVVLGGGHGQAAVLRGLKQIDDINISAIVTVADDGGSTGVLRSDFNMPAMGDIRNVMISLAESESLLTDLMDYRFEESESSMSGHNLGNIIITALTQSSGDFMSAISIISQVLKVKGNIIPSSTQVITLFAEMEDGTIVKGESDIPRIRNKINRVFYQQDVIATQQAINAIIEADLIIYGVGSLYTSICPNIIIPGIKDALNKSKARKIYFCNCMTQSGETEEYSLEDHVEAIQSHGNDHIDLVYYASDDIPGYILDNYRKEFSEPVKIIEHQHEYPIICCSLLEFNSGKIRHSADKIRDVILKELGR